MEKKPIEYWINLGHWKGDKGGKVGSHYESDLILGIRDELKKLLPNAHYVSDDLNLKESIAWINEKCNPQDIAIGIHLNKNDDKTIRGTEGYYYKNYKLAKTVAKNVADSLSIPNRGPKPDTQSGPGSLGFCRQLKCNSIVLECAYMTNNLDMAKIINDDFEKNVARGIYDTVMVVDDNELQKEITGLEKLIQSLLALITSLLTPKK